MADISSLGTLNAVEPLDLDNYVDNREGTFQLPPKGRYTVQAPPAFPPAAFAPNKARTALTAQVDPTIIGPAHEGFQIRFVKVSAKAFKRGGVTVSQLGDYLRACGVKGRLTNEQEQADAVEQTANMTYQVDIDWRAYNKGTGFSVEGMERFPSDGNGGHLPWIEDPSAKDEEGNPVRVRANINVVRYVPAV